MATTSMDEQTSKKVIRQVEFYFSDSNLPRDVFLKKTINESEDGMVNLDLICSFSRMRSHLGLGEVKPNEVSEDTVKDVAETLRASTFLKVSEDGKKVGRTTELLKPEEVIEQVDVRTIAASPFEYDMKREDVESYFGQFAKVNSVRLPRHVADKRLFCGTALIEFSTEEEAEKVLKQNVFFSGVELELKTKKDFDEERARLTEDYENSPSIMRSDSKKSSDTESNYPKGLIVAFNLKRKSPEAHSETNGTDCLPNSNETKREVDSKGNDTEEGEKVLSDEEKPKENVEKEEKEESKEDLDGKVSLEVAEKEALNGDSEASTHQEETEVVGEEKTHAAAYINNKDVVMREDLKSVFTKYGNVKYVDFAMGSESGYIRFEESEAAQKARAAAVLAEEGGLPIKNYIATLEPVTGVPEKEYWSQLRGHQQDRYRGNKGNRGRGGRHKGGKHFRSGENEAFSGRPKKAQKVGAT